MRHGSPRGAGHLLVADCRDPVAVGRHHTHFEQSEHRQLRAAPVEVCASIVDCDAHGCSYRLVGSDIICTYDVENAIKSTYPVNHAVHYLCFAVVAGRRGSDAAVVSAPGLTHNRMDFGRRHRPQERWARGITCVGL